MNDDGRTITIKVRVTVDEYVAITHVCEGLGHSQSSLGRHLYKKAVERFYDDSMTQQKLFGNGDGPKRARS